MKKIFIIPIMVLLATSLAVVAANAAIYDDGDNTFIEGGKIVFPAWDLYSTEYHDSGLIKNEEYIDRPGFSGAVFRYEDEDFYNNSNKGRVTEIVPTGGNHLPLYTFEYYTGTDSVKTMTYRSMYGISQQVFNYSEDGTIRSSDKYRFGNSFSIEHKEYDYSYYRRTDKIKKAKRTIVRYALQWDGEWSRGNVTSEETNRRYYYRNGNIRREIDIKKTYEDIDGEPKLKSITTTIDRYSRSGTLKRQDYRYREYNPETGRLVKYERERTVYNANGTKTVRSNFYNWEAASRLYGHSRTKYDVHGNIVSTISYSTSIHSEGIDTFRQNYTYDYTYDGDEIVNTEYSYFARQTTNGVLSSTYSTESTSNADYRREVNIITQYENGRKVKVTTLNHEIDHATGEETSTSIVEEYEYYASGNLKYKTVSEGDDGYPKTKYTYYNNDFYGNGIGRLKRESVYYGASPHAFGGAFTYTYWGDTETIKVKEHFYGPVGRDVYEYFESGNLENYTESWAGFTLKTLTYADIDYNGDGIGRILEETRGDHTGVTARFVYRDHYDGSEQYRYKDEYDANDNLIATYEYDEDGNAIGEIQNELNERMDVENLPIADPPEEPVEAEPTIQGDQEVLARLAVAEESSAKRGNTSKLTYYNELKAKKSKWLDWLKN